MKCWWEAVLLSQDGCNKLPQTRWLKTTEIYFLTVLKAPSLNQGVGRASHWRVWLKIGSVLLSSLLVVAGSLQCSLTWAASCLSTSFFTWSLPLHVSLCVFFSTHKTNSHQNESHYNNCNELIYKDPIFKCLLFEVDMKLGSTEFTQWSGGDKWSMGWWRKAHTSAVYNINVYFVNIFCFLKWSAAKFMSSSQR